MRCVSALPSFSHTDDGWEIDKEELTLGRELDSGQFGVSTSVVLSTCTSGRTVTSLNSHVPCTHGHMVVLGTCSSGS